MAIFWHISYPSVRFIYFGRTKVIETIVTLVYKQGHLVLGFQYI